jgi:integrase
MIVAALESGMRGGELRALRWADVQNGWFVLHTHKTIKRTGRKRRVPISPTLQQILDRRRKGPDGQDLADDAHVFGDATGLPVARRLANRRWRAACDAAKIQDLNFHDLRHEMGSATLEAGASVHEVKDILGHTSLTMTQRYLNATELGTKDAIGKNSAKRARSKIRAVGQ